MNRLFELTPPDPDLISSGAETAPVRVSVWIDASAPAVSPRSSAPRDANLRIGAEGVHLRAATRAWYVPFKSLLRHELAGDDVVLTLVGGRCLRVHSGSPEALTRRLQERLVAYARHALLAERSVVVATPTSSTNDLLTLFENPATPVTRRVEIARWLGTRPLKSGDPLFLKRILRDVADPVLRDRLERALDLGSA